jgi:predicted hydrocarbon binding protein
MTQPADRFPSFRERLVFDADRGELRDGDARYLLMRHDSLTGMFARLPETARRQALAALGDAVAAAGGRSAGSYMAASPHRSNDLLRMIEATASQLGWGRWTFVHSHARALGLHVVNSPFAVGAGPCEEPACVPIAGMLRAVASLVFSAPAAAEETACAAAGRDACRFRAWVAAGADQPSGG